MARFTDGLGGLRLWITAIVLGLSLPALGAAPAAQDKPDKSEKTAKGDEREVPRPLKDEAQSTMHSMALGGRTLTYQAEAGVLVVHLKDPLDEESPPAAAGEHGAPPAPPAPEASMSYVAYFLGKEPDPRRPITFLFNGGPGSSTVWLHMGSFGPKRVLATDMKHGPAAPYRVVDNAYTLLIDSDLVFVDAPGTGFSHLRGADKEKAFYGVDQDAHAFAIFMTDFLSRHGRWNSPKYVFGESYGTMRAAALVFVLQTEKGLDPTVAMAVRRRQRGHAAIQPGRRPALSTHAAELRGHGLVSQEATGRAGDARAVPRRGRGIRARRLYDGARRRRATGRGAPRSGGCEAARLHGAADRVPRARGPAHQRRRVQPARARREHDGGPPRHALHGTDARSAQ